MVKKENNNLFSSVSQMAILIVFVCATINTKAQIVTDRDIYFQGDEIWFSLLTTQHNFNNNYLHVSLLSPNGNKIAEQKLEINKEFSGNKITIPNTLKQGNYLLTTSYFDSSKITFNKIIPIYDPFEKINLQSASDTGININVLTESPLVYGLPTKIAFYIEGFNPRMIAFLNDTMGMVKQISVSDKGYGYLDVTPQKNNPLRFTVYENDSIIKEQILPKAEEKGLTLQLKENAQSFHISIFKTPDFALNKPISFSLFKNGDKIVTDYLNFLASREELEFYKDNLPTGILTISLSVGSEEYIGRFFYNPQEDNNLNIDVSLNKNSLRPGEQGTLQIKVKDKNGSPKKAKLALSITDNLTSPTIPKNNLVECLQDNFGSLPWLEKIPTSNKDVNELLLLSLNEKDYKNIKPREISHKTNDDGFSIKGFVYLPMTEKRISNQMILLTQFGEDQKIDYTYADQFGNFEFNNIEPFYGTNNFILQLTQKEEYCEFKIYREDSLIMSNYTLASRFSESLNFYLEKNKVFDPYDSNNKSKNKLTFEYQCLSKPRIVFKNEENNFDGFADRLPLEHNEKVIRAIKQKRLSSEIQNIFLGQDSSQIQDTANLDKTKYLTFYGKPDYRIFLDEYIDFSSVEEMMRDLIYAVRVKEKDGQRKLIMQGEKGFLDKQPVVFINGIITFESDVVLNMDPDIIESIDLVYDEARLDSLPFIFRNGIFAIYTKYNTFNFAESHDRLKLKIQGLEEKKEFEAENTSLQKIPTFSQMPNLNSTVYWNPMIETDENGEATVTFYQNSNLTGDFSIKVNAVSENGLKGNIAEDYSVILGNK